MRLVVAAALALLPAIAEACDFTGFPERVTGHGVTLAWRAEPALTVGGPQALDVVVCGADGKPLKLMVVDAFMPAHGHGMNYETEVVASGAGRYRVDGLLLHMPGRWQIWFDVQTPSGKRRLVQEIDLE